MRASFSGTSFMPATRSLTGMEEKKMSPSTVVSLPSFSITMLSTVSSPLVLMRTTLASMTMVPPSASNSFAVVSQSWPGPYFG